MNDRDAIPLWAAYAATRSVEARNALVEHYLPLVKIRVARMRHKLSSSAGYTEKEVLSSGALGLIRAVERFDPSRGTKFATYASVRISGAILDGFRATDWVPRLVRQAQKKLEQLQTDKQGGSDHELDLLLNETKVPLHISLSRARRGSQDSGRVQQEIDVIPDRSADEPWRRLQQADVLDLLMRKLKKRDRKIMLLYHADGLAMRQIARLLRVSESRVSQIIAAVHSRLRETFRNREADLREEVA
jgi:RNA polymerase sigma factor for flagellar operon FliA